MSPSGGALPTDPVVFLEKLRRPAPGGLTRRRLEDRVIGPSAPSTVLVLGPAGSGKTTLLGRVAASTVGPAAWYRVSSEDHTEAALVNHLGLALGSALENPGIVETAVRGGLDALLTALEGVDHGPLQLVVDDLHEIAGSCAERCLERFISLRPRTIQVALGSRRPPPSLNIPRLLVSGELGQLDADDLRFRTWEVEELFRGIYQQSLAPETAAALARRTGGWAAGLQLFHLATCGLTRLELDRAVGELNGRSGLIRSYLARNVLEGLDDVRRSFLLRTSTLGVLSSRMCDALLQTTGSAAVLQDLERQQFFTTSTDAGMTYRYHQVLQTHLELLLNEDLGCSEARAWYARSGAILEEAGHHAAALRAYARADDWGAVARLLQQTSSAVPPDEPTWLAGVSGLGAEDPWIAVADARRMFRSGRVDEAVSGFRRAESALEDADFRARCALERMLAEDWLPTAPATDPGETWPADPQLRMSRSLRLMTRSVAHVEAETGLVGGIGRLLAGDATGASVHLRAALREPALATWERLAIRLAAQLPELDNPAESSARLLEEIVLLADMEALPWLARIARGLQYVVVGADRAVSGRELVAECRRQGDRWATCILGLVLGAASLPGDAEAGAELLRLAEQAAAELDAPVLQVWAESLGPVSSRRRNDSGASRTPSDVRARAGSLGVDLGGRLLAVSSAVPAGGPAAPRADESPRTELRCLGSFELKVNGTDLARRRLRPRAQTLLMFLAMRHGHGIHREILIDALWPDATLSSGIRSLQVSASSVRQCLVAGGLPETSLQRRGEAYALCLTDVSVQVEDIERLTSRAAWLEGQGELNHALRRRLEVLDLYRGDLLPEAGPAEWVVPERNRLRELAAGTGADAARLALRLGELTVGVRAAQRSIELDPYRDGTWDLLVEGFERMGDRSAAAVARRHHSLACAELGI